VNYLQIYCEIDIIEVCCVIIRRVRKKAECDVSTARMCATVVTGT
jgi:hypothetical protein